MTDTYRIKALCWERSTSLDSSYSMKAITFFGIYEIYDLGNSEFGAVVDTRFHSGRLALRCGLETAQAACDRHYHDTIKQALEEV